ncbi:MAG: amidohydrolase [Nitrososphaerota archaeon]|nr:amidohydrolase [Nitrososphaerota archaeon]MDG6922853.1 amidohydrolase [Nitrososphaerota archaeon]
MKYIDCHTHITPHNMLRKSSLEFYLMGREGNQEIKRIVDDPAFFVDILDEANVEKAFLITIVSPDIEGQPFEYNDFIAKYARNFPDRLIPIGSISPRLTIDAKKDFEYVIDYLGMKGLKIHPPHQLVYPNEYRTGNSKLAILYSMAQERHIPVVIHTGTSTFPGARNVYGDPIYTDDIGVDYPDLTVILAHGGRPLWTQTAFFLVRRHKNFYLDVSGTPPRSLLNYFPRLEEVSEKVMFGSDWAGPMIPGIKTNIEELLKLPLSEKAKENVLRNTALKALRY